MLLPVVSNLCSYIPACVCVCVYFMCEGSCLGGCVSFSSKHVNILRDEGKQIILAEVHIFIHESLLSVQSAALSLFCNLCTLLTQCFSNFLGQTELSLKFYCIQGSNKKGGQKARERISEL